MTRVLAIDAGDMTGLAVVDFESNGTALCLLEQFAGDVTQTMHRVAAVIRAMDVGVVVAEQFNLRPGNQFVADLSTVYRNGALEYMLAVHFGIDPVWQTPAQAKGLVSDMVLKRLGSGFWPTGKTVGYKDANDARDALRHAVFYAVEVLNHRPTIELGWPKPKEV